MHCDCKQRGKYRPQRQHHSQAEKRRLAAEALECLRREVKKEGEKRKRQAEEAGTTQVQQQEASGERGNVTTAAAKSGTNSLKVSR